MKKTCKIIQVPIIGLAIAALALGPLPASWASSHSDAPLIKQDPQANLTDVYAFIGNKYNDPSVKVLNVLVSVRPFSDPGDGVIYDRFADDALYSIHITHPVTGADLIRYDFRFSDASPTVAGAGLKNPNTILSYGLGTEAGPIEHAGDARQNFSQTYSVSKNSSTIGTTLLTPPPNVGKRTTPYYNDPATGQAISGADSNANLDRYTREAIYSLSNGDAVFAGPRDDAFFADTTGIFDLLDPRIIVGLGQAGGGVDGFKGFNVLTYGVQIPVSSLTSYEYTAAFANLADPLPSVAPAKGVGVYASVSRARTTLRKTDGDSLNTGPWVQVNRLANPLFNEVLVALKDKDKYNRTKPTGDAAYSTYAQNPEVAKLINIVLFGDPEGDGPLAASGRGDLALVYIPDVIRVDTTTPPVRVAGQTGHSPFGFVGGDTTTDSSGRVKSSGWPNGRRVGDDVVDIALTAIASGPSYSSVLVVGDNVPANDAAYNQVFPYLATPHAGSAVTQRSAP